MHPPRQLAPLDRTGRSTPGGGTHGWEMVPHAGPPSRSGVGAHTPVFRGMHTLGRMASPGLSRVGMSSPSSGWMSPGGGALALREPMKDPEHEYRVALAGMRDPITARSDEPGRLSPVSPKPRGGTASSLDRLSALTGGRSDLAAAEDLDADLKYCCEKYWASCQSARLATRLCFSCKRLEPRRVRAGFYCEECFLRRHPWTRMPHNWIVIQQVPPPKPPTIDQRPEKQFKATTKLMDETKQAITSLDQSSLSTYSERRAAARHCDDLLERVMGLLSTVRDDGMRAQLHAARVLQGFWRIATAKKMVQTRTRLMWGKVLDVSTNKYYYVNRRTGKTQWEKPKTFYGADLGEIGNYPRVLSIELSEYEAARKIVGMFHVRRARQMIRTMVDRIWRVIVDRKSGRKYYYNTLTLKTQWKRPHMMGSERDDVKRTLRADDPRIARAGAAAEAASRSRVASESWQPELKEGLPKAPDADVHFAATVIQSRWRAAWARRACRLAMKQVLRKTWDSSYECYYYYNPRTGFSSWTKPLLLGNEDVLAETVEGHVRTGRRSEELSEEQATLKLQAFIRQCRARKRMRLIARSVWAKVMDPEYHVPYYYNKLSGLSQWERPFALEEGDDLTTEAPTARSTARPGGPPTSRDSARMPRSARMRIHTGRSAAPSARGMGPPPESARNRPSSRSGSARARFFTPQPGSKRFSHFPPLVEDLSTDTACTRIQSLVRRFLARRELVRRMSHVIEKHLDEDYKIPFYFDTRTQEASWEKPRLLQRSKLDLYTPEELEAVEARRGAKKQLVRNSSAHDVALSSARLHEAIYVPAWLPRGVRVGRWAKDLSEEEARVKLQSSWRMWLARRALMRLCVELYEKVIDPEWETPFYWCSLDNESMWDKPRIFRGSDIPLVSQSTSRALKSGVTPRGLPSSRSSARGTGRNLVPLQAAVGLEAIEEEEEASSRVVHGPQAAAAMVIQGLVRMRQARDKSRQQALRLFESVSDAESGSAYWYSKIDGTSQWDTPRLVKKLFGSGSTFLREHSRLFESLNVRHGVREGHFAKDLTEEQALVKIQSAVRAKLARTRARKRLIKCTLRLWSEKWQCWYYFNTQTKRSSWLRPPLLIAQDDGRLQSAVDDGRALSEIESSLMDSARSSLSLLGPPPESGSLTARQSARFPGSARSQGSLARPSLSSMRPSTQAGSRMLPSVIEADADEAISSRPSTAPSSAARTGSRIPSRVPSPIPEDTEPFVAMPAEAAPPVKAPKPLSDAQLLEQSLVASVPSEIEDMASSSVLPAPLPSARTLSLANEHPMMLTQQAIIDIHLLHMGHCLEEGRAMYERIGKRLDGHEHQVGSDRAGLLDAEALLDACGGDIDASWAELERLFPSIAGAHLAAADTQVELTNSRLISVDASHSMRQKLVGGKSLLEDAERLRERRERLEESHDGGSTTLDPSLGRATSTRMTMTAEALSSAPGPLMELKDRGGKFGQASVKVFVGDRVPGDDGSTVDRRPDSRGMDAPDVAEQAADALQQAKDFFRSVPDRFGASRMGE
jgi:hypothetical protein